MKRNVLIFGIILGLLLCVYIVCLVHKIYNNPGIEGNVVVGYATLVTIFSLTFFGIRNYRNKELNGVISFGKAFKTGALIAFVGSTMYVIMGLLYYYVFTPDFIDKYIEHLLLVATNAGASAAEIAAQTEQMSQFKDMYQNPIFVVLITYMEVLPIGLIIALISSFILKKKAKSEN